MRAFSNDYHVVAVDMRYKCTLCTYIYLHMRTINIE